MTTVKSNNCLLQTPVLQGRLLLARGADDVQPAPHEQLRVSRAMKTAFSFVADFLAGIALLWAVQSSADQFSSVPREDFWQPGPGIINAVAQANGVIYVGGSFQSVLRSQPSGVGAYDLNSGTRDPDFPLVAGTAFAVLPDNEGGWFIGGDFSAIGGVSVKNLAHVRADKTVDPNWAPGEQPPRLFSSFRQRTLRGQLTSMPIQFAAA
ncbi:MAG: hypothetical protein U1G07_04135 [Verrucomicrobiota bacterium]